MQARDQSDRTRTASPLIVAADAIHIDTTHLSIEQVVDQVLGIVRRKTAGTAAR
jgi:cytidylate kinase